MKASFAWFVALRYLRAKRRQRFISLITCIATLGVAVGVMALIVVMSVWSGFIEALRDQIIGLNAHVTVQSYRGQIDDPPALMAKIARLPGVVAQSPVIYTQALLSSPSTSTGLMLRGLDPDRAGQVLQLESKIRQGSLQSLRQDKPPALILGQELGRQLQTRPGERLRLFSPNGTLSPMGLMPKIRACRVVGLLASGTSEYDSSLGYVSLATARSLAGLEGEAVHALELKVDPVSAADRLAQRISDELGPDYLVRDWMSLNANLFAALKLEKLGIFIALDLIILVAALNIISALIMMVMEKTKDIAILKAMGAKTGDIMRIFLYQGLVIGLVGLGLGLISGLSICYILKNYKIIELPPNVYPMSTIPIKVVASDVSLIALSALAITLLATLYPSRKAARVQAAEALSYE